LSEERHGQSWLTLDVAVFVFLACAITWSAAFLRSTYDAPIGLVVKYGPSLAGVIATALFAGRRGLLELVRRLSPFRARPHWIAFAVILPVLLGAVTLGARALFFGPVPSVPGLGVLGSLGIFGGELSLRFFAGGGLGEELGWRGFMLPRMLERCGWLRASIWVGVCHGLWHAPAQGPAVLVLTFYTVGGAIVFTWMAGRTGGSIFLAALLHASGNATLFSIERIWPELDNDLTVQMSFLLLWWVVAGALIMRTGRDG